VDGLLQAAAPRGAPQPARHLLEGRQALLRVKVEVSAQHAEELMDAIKEIHTIFWSTKGRDVAWYTAS